MPYANNPFLSRGLASTTLHPLGLEVTGARGPWIHVQDGTRLFDAISGIGVSNFGHGHESIQRELQSQLDTHLHTMVYGEFLQGAQTRASQAARHPAPGTGWRVLSQFRRRSHRRRAEARQTCDGPHQAVRRDRRLPRKHPWCAVGVVERVAKSPFPPPPSGGGISHLERPGRPSAH